MTKTGPFASIHECVVRVQEEQDVSESEAREICDNIASQYESMTAAEYMKNDKDQLLTNKTIDAQENTSPPKSAQSDLGNEGLNECISRIVREDQVDRSVAEEACNHLQRTTLSRDPGEVPL